MFRKLKTAGLTTKELILVYKGYIRPIIEYAAPAWHSSLTLGQTNQLELVQKRVCRILFSSKYQNYDQALCELDLDSLLERRKKLCSKFAFKNFQVNKIC